MTKTTGWPPPELMQDDDKRLFAWFASKPDSRRLVREHVERIMVKAPKQHTYWFAHGQTPKGVDEEFARKIIQRRRQMMMFNYIRCGLSKPYGIHFRTLCAWARELEQLQSAWGWQGYEFYDDLFENWIGPRSMSTLPTNNGGDSGVNNAALYLLQQLRCNPGNPVEEEEKEPSPL
jgi:hypothetical protein